MKQQLEKLQLFEELDRRLMERVGVHLADVGDLSSPALAKILKDTECPSDASTSSSAFHHYQRQHQQYPAPSPAASAAGAPAAAGGLIYPDENSSIGIDLSKSATPGASLASILNGGAIEPSSYGQVAGSRVGRGGGGGAAAARAATAAREAGLPQPPYLVDEPGSPNLSASVDGGADSPAASGISSSMSGVSSGISSITPNRGMSPVNVGGRERSMSPESLAGAGGTGGRNGGRLSHSNSLAASPLSTQPYAYSSGGGGAQAVRFGESSTVGVPAASGGRGDIDNLASSSVEVYAGRGWISSPIAAKNVGKEDRSVPTPWDRSGSGSVSGSGGAPSYHPGDGLGFVGEGDSENPDGAITRTTTKTTRRRGGGSAGDGGGSQAEEGRWESEPEPRQQHADFDENVFAKQEQRMRHAFLQRMGSEESPAPSVGRNTDGLVGVGDGMGHASRPSGGKRHVSAFDPLASSPMREHNGQPSIGRDSPSHG